MPVTRPRRPAAPAAPGVSAASGADGGSALGRVVSWAPGPLVTILTKVTLLGAVNAVGLYGLMVTVGAGAYIAAVAVVLATAAINVAWLSKRRITWKYLVPGTLLLIAFQVYPVGYNVYIAFTNYGSANNLTREQAIARIEANSAVPGADGVRYVATGALGPDGELALLLTRPETEVVRVGTVDGVTDVTGDDVVRDGDRVLEAAGYVALDPPAALDRRRELSALVVPIPDGAIQLQTLTTAAELQARLRYDDAAGSVIDVADGTVYREADGAFVSDAGVRLSPGWRTVVGTSNFERVLTSPAIRGPFLRVLVWTVAFASLSVALTFALGLLLALVLQHPTMKLRRLYRSILILPYALPSFMTALIWAGLLNTRFGAVNRTLGLSIDWLGDPWMARGSVLLVNLWLGFPYMLLVTMGALQSIPDELGDAARVDGASALQRFRTITLPLLLVSVSPLLIASFAFNFNNFNVIYLLTGGDPPIVGAQTPAGHTDILISYTYRLAFAGGRGADYGLAAAISVIIFLIVAVISILSFRRTKAFEELHR